MKRFSALVRQVHLLSGLLLALVACFFVISGAAILFSQYLPGTSADVTTVEVPMPPAAVTADQATLRDLMALSAGARGRLQPIEAGDDGTVRLRTLQPGLQVVAVLSPDRSNLTVTRTRFGVIRVLRTLHTVTGYEGGPAYVAWSVVLDLVSLAMIGFAVSGIFLWYRLVRDRRLGWIILGGSWAYVVGLIAYLVLG